MTPNPANHKVFVNSVEGENSYKIFDPRGRSLKKGKLNTDKSINIEELSKGVYFLKIRGKQPIKFIKERI
ncbi:T9SS type A sorting domain-containing protein [Mesonia ostreae]|uniref:T9SS type A sorting domain-containing protein n=1 Tax=Mesonia ostreae TaxID=861110 RepID=UPI0035D015EA